MLATLDMPAANGVAKGQTATFRLPIGYTYHELYLTLGGLAASIADVTGIRVYANSKEIHNFSGTVRNAMNLFDGRNGFSGNADTLVIPFNRTGLKTPAAEVVTALVTGGDPNQANVISELRVEVDFTSSGTYTPTADLHALVSTGGSSAGVIIHTRKFTFDIGASGEYDIATFARGGVSTSQVNRIWFAPSANDLNSVRLEVNQKKAFNRTKALNELVQTDGVRTPQSGYVVTDFTEKGYGGEVLDLRGAQDFRAIVNASGAMTLTAYVEYLGALGD